MPGPDLCFRRDAGRDVTLMETRRQEPEELFRWNTGVVRTRDSSHRRGRGSYRVRIPWGDRSLWARAGPQTADLWPGRSRAWHQISLTLLSIMWGGLTHHGVAGRIQR